MDIETIVIGGALIINAVGTTWSIVETSKLHKQAEELQESNANLQSEVNRLSTHLNQEIVRLNRLNELARGLYLSSARLNFKYRLSAALKGKDSQTFLSEVATIDEITDVLITVKGSIIEMTAIATVIGDDNLLSLISELESYLPDYNAELSQDEWFKKLSNFENNVTALHEKVYSLLQAATETV